MNKLFKSIVAASVGVAMAIGVGVGLGREASAVYAAGAGTDVLFAKGFGSYTNNSFSAAGTDRTGVANGTNVSGVTYALQVFNGSTGAVRGNQNAGSANFSARNTTTQTGYYISSVSLTVSGGTIDGSTDGRSVVYFGSSAFGNPNSGAPSGTPTSATPASSGQTTLSWTNSDPDCNYFILYHLKTSGTALSANATTSLKVVWSPATKVAVSYVSEYGTLSKTSEQVLPGSTITLPTISNKPSNYSFEGFSDGNDNVYDEGETVTINSATTFTAIWREIKVLSSISVSGQTTTFEQGDAFVFGGTVTANYADSTSADVTSKAVFSGYDMVTAGNQTVTVSYTEGQITKTTTYDITVNVISSIMFVGGTDVGSTSSNNSADSVTKAGITMSCTDAAFATTEYRFYGGSTLTFTSSVEKIARIEFTQCDNSRPVSNLGPAEGTLSSGVWTGTASTTVTFNPTAQVRASHVKVVLDNAAPVEGETEDHPFTVAQAKAHIDAVIAGGNDTGNNGSSYYVTGIVSSIVTPLTSGYITYNISDDGTTESQQLEVYKGKSFDGANFTEEDDIKVGAVVKVHGRLKLYNEIYEFDTGAQLVSYEAPYEPVEDKISNTKTQTALSLDKVYSNAVVDTLTHGLIGVEGTGYAEWEDIEANSDAVYAGDSAGGSDDSGECIQLRSNNSNSGIVTTASGGYAVKVVVEWNAYTAATRTLNVYGSNSPYTAASELYNGGTSGTLLGTIVKGTSTELEISGEYEYIGVRSAGNAMYLDSISITWSSSTTPTYKNAAIRFSAVIKQDLWDELDGDSHAIKGFGMMFSSTVSELINAYNSALASAGNMAGAIQSIKDNASIRYFDNSEISGQVHDGAGTVATPDSSDGNYIWTLYKGVSTSNFSKPYHAVAFIKLENELIFLQEATASIQSLAGEELTRTSILDKQFSSLEQFNASKIMAKEESLYEEAI